MVHPSGREILQLNQGFHFPLYFILFWNSLLYTCNYEQDSEK